MKRALLSVSDRSGLVEFAKGLVALDYEIIATGSTKTYLEQHGLKNLISVETVTGFEEMMDGRVKTLHPLIHGALLGLRDNPNHREAMERHNITPIDLVVVNLYPFKDTIKRGNIKLEEAIEQIDIGGPSMLRSAAKNFKDVMVIIDPNDYEPTLKRIETDTASLDYRLYLAAKVFSHTAYYDSIIADFLNQQGSTPVTSPRTFGFELKQSLRYGENPHQGATFYETPLEEPYSLSSSVQRHGKELSYNNIQDANATLNMLADFSEDFACVVVKHMNPCGIALGSSIEEAFNKAYDSDPVSIFGGIVAVNAPVSLALAEKLSKIFLEIILAPAFDEEAFALLSKKKNIRLIEFSTQGQQSPIELKSVNGGLLIQDKDVVTPSMDALTCVTETQVDESVIEDLIFAQKVVKHVKSNAIVVVKHKQTLGIGAGQMNRVGAANIALEQAKNKAGGAVLASDAFFPMRDTVDLASKYNIKAIIQPGGSLKDQDSIDACNESGIAMVFTGTRHFKH